MELVSLEAFSLASKPSINLLFKGKCISREGLSYIQELIFNVGIRIEHWNRPLKHRS